MVACDHYHRLGEDIALMSALGLRAYRFSIAWPRVLPEGTGAVNAAGLDFYDRLVDGLLAAGITPWATLFHWDYPAALQDRGGWLHPDSPRWFSDYVQVIATKLSDRVRHWITLNEPQCFIGLGLGQGLHAPGERRALPEVLLAAHHVLLAHGRAVQAIRATARQPVQIGMAPVGVISIPATEQAADVAAARTAMFAATGSPLGEVWSNTWWADPTILGHYPADGLAAYGAAMPAYDADDLKVMAQPLDFYGVNIYSGERIRASANGEPEKLVSPPETPRTHLLWEVRPESLYWGARFLGERYKLPIFIAENGMSNVDWPALDGQVLDPQRIDFTRRYLRELRRALDEGVDVRGYFHWSLLDNFEWAEGYKHRFGLIYVNFETQQRTIKASGHWYREVIRSHGANL
jgi:beta-glucosidase